jgi:Polyketide cyclase / dehydrase and lipid transport
VRMTIEVAWECQRSVEADVPVSFAWQFMADLRSWSDPPAEFTLDGPFANGSRGTTRMPGRPPASWTLRDVEPGRGYTIEGGSFLERAQFLVYWRFEPAPDGRTTLTQRMELRGENAAAYVADISAAFEPNLEPGMRRIAGLMQAALRSRYSGEG